MNTISRKTAIALLLAIPFVLFLSVAAFAQEAKPSPASTCGKTAEECQKVVDARDAAIAVAEKRLAVYGQLLTEANDRLVAAAAK